MTQPSAPSAGPTIEDLPWPQLIEEPPTNLPYDDGEPMESPWHFKSAALLVANYVAAQGRPCDDYYIGANMFVYYSWRQLRNEDYKGPDVFIVKNVDGTRHRLYWSTWEEDGRYPDVIFELLSESTESNDLGQKKNIYEQIFRTREYFCVAPEVERLMGWRLNNGQYVPIEPNEYGWLWSKELELWLGRWDGMYLGEQHTWLRLYHADGALVLLPEEAALQRAALEAQRAETEAQRAEAALAEAESERQRADDLAARLAALEEELKHLRG